VRDWHLKVTKNSGPVYANRAAQLLRATYRYAARLNRSLPPALPTSAVAFNREVPRETGIKDFEEWATAWRAIPSPVKRGFHLANLLLGARPGELARVEWTDIDRKERKLVIRAGKIAGVPDTELPLTWPIVRALKMARGADSVLVFPAARHNVIRDRLPVHGHSLRHAYRSVAKALGVDDMAAKLLMGHSLKALGVSAGYLSKGMLRDPLRKAQREISSEILKRLGIKV